VSRAANLPGESQDTERPSFADLVDAAGAEMHGHAIRYGDIAIASSLRDFDAQGLLQGPARYLAARIVAELLTRTYEFDHAIARVESIRTGGHPIEPEQGGSDA
jgi:hypothetical protein